MQQLDFVSKRQTNWRVYIGLNLLQRLPKLVDLSGHTKIGIVVDENVAKLHLVSLVRSLSRIVNEPIIITLPVGERTKSLTEAERIYRILFGENFDRQSLLLAFGGGVVGDLTGFTAATYLRGLDFVQIPTTLLAQVDASIGGKAGVNFKGLKNMIGTFHQPLAIMSDISLLKTLSKRELRSGLAEVVKYGLIKDKKIFVMLEKTGEKLSEKQLEELVIRSTKIKGKIVDKDELEKSGERALLNFGHTLGHAVEAVANGEYTHGEAISIGMTCAARVSLELDMLSTKEHYRIVAALKHLGLPTKCSLQKDALLEKMAYDKKNISTKPRWVLLKKIGTAVSRQEVAEKIIQDAVDYVLI